MNEEILLARRSAVGMAAQVAQGNAEEFALLMNIYLQDAIGLGLPKGTALGLLANVSIGLAVQAHSSDVDWFYKAARSLAVEA